MEQPIRLLAGERGALGHSLDLAIREANSVSHDIPCREILSSYDTMRAVRLDSSVRSLLGLQPLSGGVLPRRAMLRTRLVPYRCGERGIERDVTPRHLGAKSLDLVVGERVDGGAAFDFLLPVGELRVKSSRTGAARLIAALPGQFYRDVQSSSQSSQLLVGDRLGQEALSLSSICTSAAGARVCDGCRRCRDGCSLDGRSGGARRRGPHR